MSALALLLGFLIISCKLLSSSSGELLTGFTAFKNSSIPNTAEVAYYGLLKGFKNYINEQKIKKIESLGHTPTH
ncbi:MAG: hypothetical protein K6F69_10515, partial [Treponema sp.]|nr:hypothetical protein [Treponema sp.]